MSQNYMNSSATETYQLHRSCCPKPYIYTRSIYISLYFTAWKYNTF